MINAIFIFATIAAAYFITATIIILINAAKDMRAER